VGEEHSDTCNDVAADEAADVDDMWMVVAKDLGSLILSFPLASSPPPFESRALGTSSLRGYIRESLCEISRLA
jgi:hypothetical protein